MTIIYVTVSLRGLCVLPERRDRTLSYKVATPPGCERVGPHRNVDKLLNILVAILSIHTRRIPYLQITVLRSIILQDSNDNHAIV